MAEVSTRNALLILLLFALLLAARFWAYGEAVGLNGLSYLHRHPSGDIGILLGNHLYRFDSEERLQQVIDLARYGVPPDQVTDFAWFSNGDLLLRQGRREEGLRFAVERFFRRDNRTPDQLEQPGVALYRCDTTTAQCRPFTQPALNLNDAFAVEIGKGMEHEVGRSLEDGGLLPGRVLPDLAGIIRVVVAHQPMG